MIDSYTPVHNRFWSDGWVRQLNALDRYFFLYLLTNGRGGRTGIYELPLDLMAAESGIDEKDLRHSMLIRLEPKVFYKEGWVILTNYPRHLIGDGPKFWAGVRASFEELPPKIQEIAKDCRYPIDTLSIGYSRFSNRIDKNRIDMDDFVIKNENEKHKKVTPEMQEVFDIFTDRPARFVWKTRVHEREAAKVLHESYGIEELKKRYSVVRKYRTDPLCPQIDSPSDFLEKMPKMEKFLKTI